MVMNETMERSCTVVSACEASLHALARLGDPMAALAVRMVEKWPSAIVARSQVKQFTGGMYAPKTMRNYDSNGKGLKRRGSTKEDGRIFYDSWELAMWFCQRTNLYILDPQTGKYVKERPGKVA